MAVVKTEVTNCSPHDAFVSFCRAFYVRTGRHPTRSEAKVLLAGSAHETRRFERMTNNGVAGVKAGPKWQGDVAMHDTHEVENGVRVPKKEPFRAYPTVFAGFVDWLRLLAEGYPAALAGAEKGDPEAYVAGLLKGWGGGSKYFTADPGEYLAGVWANLRWFEALPGIPWDDHTSRRLPGAGPS